MEFLWLWITLGAIGAALLVALIFLLNNDWLKVTRYRFSFGLERGLKIVHLSDLHGKSFGRKNVRLIKKIAAQKPDFICITGDVIHLYRPRDKAVALQTVGALKEIAPVLYIAGNHEMRNKGYRFFRKDMIEAGALVLDDKTVEVCGLNVTGLNGASLKNGKLFKIAPEGERDILLAHEPQYIENYAKAEYKLILCGHAHGGQWRIPFTGVGLFAPGQGAFPKYTSGVHTCGKSKMIISRGLGNSEFPLRLFNRPEIVVIELLP
ncbi:MAG: metallophosphoesterase [Clostridia bacterium]|nr:metallophosphoesterase [Clostridia bacterium]